MTSNSECLFCKRKLRLDTRTGNLTQKGGVMRLYCDDCDLVFVISIHGKYHPKTSIIVSTGDGPFKADYNMARGFSTKTRVLKHLLCRWSLQDFLSESDFRNKKE